MAKQKGDHKKKTFEELLAIGSEGAGVKRLIRHILDKWGGLERLASDIEAYFHSPGTTTSGKSTALKIVAQLMTHPAAQEGEDTDVGVYSDDELREMLSRLVMEDESFREEARRVLKEYDERERQREPQASEEEIAAARLEEAARELGGGLAGE